MKKFMHDLLMFTFTEKLRVNNEWIMKMLVMNQSIDADINGKMKMLVIDENLEKYTIISGTLRGDERGDEKGDASPNHPYINFEHFQTI